MNTYSKTEYKINGEPVYKFDDCDEYFTIRKCKDREIHDYVDMKSICKSKAPMFLKCKYLILLIALAYTVYTATLQEITATHAVVTACLFMLLICVYKFAARIREVENENT